MAPEIAHILEFGTFRLDTRRKVLWQNGQPVPMPLKELEVLCALVERSGELVTKDELMEKVWAGSFVEESNLSRHIYLLRKTFKELGENEELILNVPRRGYRFTGEVREVSNGDEDFVIEHHALTRTLVEEVLERDTEGGVAATSAQPFELAPARPITKAVTSRVLIAGLVLFTIFVAGFAYLQFRKPTTAPVANIRAIAVLPFKDFGVVTDEDRLGPGLADVLITRLSTLKGFNVRPTSAVLKFDGQDSLAAGQRLEVDAVLEGSIHRDTGRVRVTARLVSINDRATIWGAQFEEQEKDLFAIQDDLSRQLAQALVSDLSDAEARMIARRPTQNIDAYQHYVKGRYFWNKRTYADAEKAIAHFEQAITIDPNYALAYSGLADCYALRMVLPPSEALPKVKAAALKAVELDDTLADAHASLSLVKVLDFDQPGVERELKRAIELNPNHALAHGWYAMQLTNTGRFKEGADAARRAQELDPTSPSLHMYAAWNSHHSRQFDRSVEEVRRAIELDPNVRTCGLAARAYAMKGTYDEAIAEGLRARAVAANGPSALAALGYVYAVAGRKQEARVLLAELKELAKKSHVSPFYMALIHAGLGDKDQALTYLEENYRKRDEWLASLKVDPAFDNLRAEARFNELLRKINLAE